MKTLAFELSTARGSVAWLDGDIEFTREWPNDRKNSAAFFQNLQAVGRKFGAPETITVGLGPGSYAGTRIAISAVIGMQLSCDARLLDIPRFVQWNAMRRNTVRLATRAGNLFSSRAYSKMK